MSDTTEMFKDYFKLLNSVDSVNKNAKAHHYKYADLPHLMESIKDVLSKNNFVISHQSNGEVLTTSLIHKSGERMETSLPLSYTKASTPQDLGSAITYFRRYNIINLMNIVVEDDDAQAAQKHKPALKVENDEF